MGSSPVTAPWYNSELGLHVFSLPETLANLMLPCFFHHLMYFSFIRDFKNNQKLQEKQVYSIN